MSRNTRTDLALEEVRREGIETFTPAEVKQKGNPQDFTRFTDCEGRTFYVHKTDAHEVRDIEDVQRYAPVSDISYAEGLDNF
ncbi:MAG: hypothetical protein M1378_00195 [Bacteroidetes bacterium]|nr:hypothetical protein [Bacteroidota bacterium]